MKSSSIFGRILFLAVLVLVPYQLFASPVIQGPVVPAMYWRSLTAGNIFYTGGSVGIGINNPGYLLEVNGTGSFYGLRLPTGAVVNYILVTDASGNARWVSTGSIISAPIETDPQVGVNTTNYIPRWNGSALVTGTLADSGSNIGIGTNIPGAKLEVQQTTSNVNAGTFYVPSGNTAGIEVAVIGTNFMKFIPHNGAGAFNSMVSAGDSSLIFSTNTVEQGNLVIGPWSASAKGIKILGTNGNVGIGTNNPTAKLSVAKDVTMNTNNTLSDGQIIAQGATTPGKQLVLGYDTNGNGHGFIKAGNDSVAWTTLALQPLSAGNVAIGMTGASYRLDVSGTGNFLGFRLPTGASNNFVLTSDATGNARWVSTGSILSLTESDPQVGTNTTNYLSKWDGSSLVASSVFDSGTGVSIGTTAGEGAFDIVTGSGRITVNSILVNTGVPLAAYVPTLTFSSTFKAGAASAWAGNTRFTYDDNGFVISHSGGVPGSPPAGPQGFGLGTSGRNADIFINSGGLVGIGNITPGATLDVTGDIRSTNYKTISLTRTLPIVVNDIVDIGSFTFTAGGGILNISLVIPSGGFSVTKSYILPIGFNETTATWTVAQPIADSGIYGANNIDLDVNVNAGVASLRIRRTAGVTAGTAYILIQQTGINSDVFAASTLTGSVAAPTALYNATTIRQVDGNVGIGTSSPSYKLDVNGTGSFAGLRVSSGASSNFILASDASGNARWISTGALITFTETDPKVGANTTNYVSKWNGSSLVAGTIYNTSTGVGIGTTSPDAKLHIADFTALPTSTGSQTTVQSLGAFTLNTERLDISNTRTGSGADWNSAGFRLQQKVDATWMGYMQFNGGNNGGVSFGVGTSTVSPTSIPEAMRIMNGGNIGIGTSSPLAKLHVSGSGLINGDFTVNGTGSFAGLRVSSGASSNFILASDASGNARWISTGALITFTETDPEVGANTTNYVSKWNGTSLVTSTIFDNGNVGIGDSNPQAKLSILGNLNFADAAGNSRTDLGFYVGTGLRIFNKDNSALVFGTSNAERMRIDSNGNIGIGTLTPGAKLHVTGSGLITGDLTIQGKLITDTIVNRTVTNVTISGSILPDTAAPLAYRDIGSNGTRWNNLYLSGQVKIGGGSPGLNKVLVSDATGLATWVTTGSIITLPTVGWGLTGNAGTASGTNFVGTTDAQDLVFKVNSTEYFRIRAGGSLVGVGYNTTMTGSNQVAIGSGAGVGMNGRYNMALGGSGAGVSMSGIQNVAMGGHAPGTSMLGTMNTAIGGYQVGSSMNGLQNTALGGGTAGSSMNGLQNTAIGGGSAGVFMSGTSNTAIGGYGAGSTSSGVENTAIGGYGAGFQQRGSWNTSVGGWVTGTNLSGQYNTAVGGYAAGSGMIGGQNLALGSYSTIRDTNVWNSVVIGSGAYSNQSGAVVIGGSGSNVGIGVPDPAAKLAVKGNGAGSMLVGGLSFTGYTALSLNGGLSDTSFNFTSSVSDNNLYINRPNGWDILFREANGANQVIIKGGGNVGIGTATPGSKLDVNGNISASGTIVASGTITAATPTANNHLATKAYVDAAVSSGALLKVYKFDGTTLLGNLVGADSSSIIYALVGTGTVITAGPADRSSGYGGEGWHYSYYTTANCTGTIYGDYNYYNGVFQGGRTFAYTDGEFYYYYYDYTGSPGDYRVYNSFWTGTSCVVSTNGANLQVVTTVNRKICGAGDCKVK